MRRNPVFGFVRFSVRLMMAAVEVLVALTFGLLRTVLHVGYVGRDLLRLASRRQLDGSVLCSACTEPLAADAALECANCSFRYYGGIFSPCPSCHHQTAWVYCEHCGYSCTSPYGVGREVPE